MHTRTHTHTQKLQYVQYHCSFVSGFRRPQLRTTHFSLAASLFSPDGEGSLCLSGLPSERARGSTCACATVFDFFGGGGGAQTEANLVWCPPECCPLLCAPSPLSHSQFLLLLGTSALTLSPLTQFFSPSAPAKASVWFS